MNEIESYWTGHTVRSEPFTSAEESLRYLEWRDSQYPLFHSLMGLWGDHSNDVVLDYGCGPANDLVGFLVHGKAKRAIGIDISSTSLALADDRLALHGLHATLIKASDEAPEVRLVDGTVDYIYCQGVLHHTSYPQEILNEFHRVLRPGGEASIMVYNHDSLFLHLYVAYERQIMQGIDKRLTTERAFSRSTDGEDCPIATPYRPIQFIEMCRKAGFHGEYRGGYFSQLEIDLWKSKGQQAINDPRLRKEHRMFLRSLEETHGYPTKDDLPVGVGGVYRLTR